MTRTLKALGLALATAFAFAALASAASAATDHFTGTVGTELKVTANEPQKFEPTTGLGKGFSCKTIKVNGSLTQATGTEITVEPLYSNCVTLEEGKETTTPATVETRGCHYTFFGTTTTGNPTGGEHANVQLKCDTPGAGSPPGITIKATAFNLKCALVIPQTIKHAVRYETISETKTTVLPTAHGIESETENSIACPGSEIHTNGSYTGSVTVEGVHLVENATP